VDVQSLTAYQETVTDLAVDLDGTNIDFSSNFPTSTSHAVSQEFRIGSPLVQRLAWVAGVYFLHEDTSQASDVHFPLSGLQNKQDSDTTNTSYAVFGELAYSFTPVWRGSVGFRYSYDESELDLEQTLIDPFGVQGAAGTITLRDKQKHQWGAVTPEFGVSFTPSRNTLYYANVSHGYKAGGYNTFAVQPVFDPEYLWAYETGIKTSLPDRYVRINAALYYYDYKDIQLLTLPPGAPVGTLPIVTNAARASVQGVDLQAWYQPVWNLELSAGAILLDAHYVKFNSIDPNNPATDPDRSGNPLPQAPDVSLVLGRGISVGVAALWRHQVIG
jgi:iron complex outermembrane receptor protein